jgi:type III secretory pathway component EscS
MRGAETRFWFFVRLVIITITITNHFLGEMLLLFSMKTDE